MLKVTHKSMHDAMLPLLKKKLIYSKATLYYLTPASQYIYIYIYKYYAFWTVARQAPLSMRFSRQEYWSRLPFP